MTTMFCRAACLLALLLLCVIAVTSVDIAVPASTIEVKNMLPPPGYPVDGDTVLRADIAYQISDYDPHHAIYTLVPLFQLAGNPMRSYNTLPNATSGLRLNAQSGTVQFEYPIRREWAERKIAKPIKVKLAIMQVTHGHDLEPIAETEYFEYKAQ
jgi:hypothetical protein